MDRTAHGGCLFRSRINDCRFHWADRAVSDIIIKDTDEILLFTSSCVCSDPFEAVYAQSKHFGSNCHTFFSVCLAFAEKSAS